MSKPKLALIPSGYKSGKVYSILPNDATGDFDFERQSIGTRVRKDGLIEEAKTVGSITNEFLYSEDFTQSNWFKSNATITENASLSPIGTNNASLMTSTSANGGIFEFDEWTTTLKTASIYVKKNTATSIQILNGSTGANVTYDLNNGIISSVSSTFQGRIKQLSNGWYRISAEHQTTGSTQTVGIRILTSGQSVYVWGAMLSEGALSDYIKTEGTTETKTVETFTDVPRLDWLNSNCPSLKLEPQRTNLQVYSEQFSKSSIWSRSRGTAIADQQIAPNGTYSADKILGDGTGTTYFYDGITLTNGVTYTISIFVKPIINISSFAINVFGGVGTAYFNLVDKTVNSTTGDFTSAKIEDYGNGWLRCSGTLTLSSATGSKNIGYGLIDFDGDQFYLFGAQVEEGAYPTSYIKTETSAVTRLKDECLNGGNSDLFNITEGTFFVDANNFGTPLNSYNMITLSDGGNNFVRFLYESSRIRTSVYNGVTQTDYFITGTSDNQRNKVAITFKENEFKTYFNGVLKDTDTSGVVPIGFNRLNFASQSGTSRHFEGKVYDTRVYNRVLTEAEAIELTTL